MHDVTLDPIEVLHCPQCGASLKGPFPEAFSTMPCANCGENILVPGKFGQFMLYECQGESVTSVVFAAHDPKLGRDVTLKILNYVLSKNPELVESFKHEALAAAALNSTNVLKVYEFGLHNRQPFMVMEHIEGKYLHDLLQQEKLGEYRILEITDGIVQGLQDMHDRGIMHGDVMPRNILIHTDGTPRISDFGLARFSGEQASDNPAQQWESWSSPYYMPPERIHNNSEDFRGDFYSLGTTLFNMLTGQLPFFDLDESKVLEQKTTQDAPDPRRFNPAISDGIAELTLMLLERNPENRPANYDELRQHLAALKAEMPRPEREIPQPEEIIDFHQQPEIKSKEPITWFIFLVLIGILGAMLVSLPHRAKKQDKKNIESVPTAVPPPTVPSATPAPTATPQPTPQPTPTPAPTATPTPVPLPENPAQVSSIEILLQATSLPSSKGSSVASWKDEISGRNFFIQSDVNSQPTVAAGPGGKPVLDFTEASMASSLTLSNRDEFTLLMLIQLKEKADLKKQIFLLGEDPLSPNTGIFLIQSNPVLPYSFRFETDRGSTLMTLAADERNQPFLVGFKRDRTGERAFLGRQQSELSSSPHSTEVKNPNAFPGLQIGGLAGESVSLQGWIAEFQLYDRALDNQQIFALAGRLNQLFGN